MTDDRRLGVLDWQLKALGLPDPVAEYRFHPTRRWRFDRAWPAYRVALEIDGGLYTRGRHVRPAGYTADCRKLNAAALLGWTVLRVTYPMLRDGAAAELVQTALQGAKIPLESP